MAAAVAVLAAGTVPGAGGAPAAVRAAEACVDGWQPVPVSDSLSAMEPNAGATVNGQPAWIVGLTTARAEGSRVPIIGAWRNGAWVRVKSPWKSFGVLNAVAASSANNAWAVGSRGAYNRIPIAARWDGTLWNKVTVPTPQGEMSTFVDMALLGPSEFWAVGARLQLGRLRPLAMHRLADGGWHTSSPLPPTGGEAGLNGVFLAPGGTLWAAGWRSDGSGQGRPWVIYRSGSDWVTSPLASVAAGRASILDLYFSSAGDGWAAGFVEGTNGYQPVLQHWSGSEWSNVPLPWAAGQSYLVNTVGVDSAGRLIVGGMHIDDYRRDLLAVLGTSGWKVTNLSSGNRDRSAMTDVVPMPSGAMVVGFHDAVPLTLFPCTTSSAATAVRPLAADDADMDPADDISDDMLPANRAVAMSLETAPLAGTVARDMTAAAGINLIAPTWSGVIGDFNGDGYPDIYVNRHYAYVPVLFLGSASGVFSIADAPNFVRRDRHGCAAADIDADLSLDLFCTIGVNKGTSNTPQELTLDPGDDGGTWGTRQFGVLDGFGRGRDTTFINLNEDAYPDLYVVNEPSRSDGQWSSNRLYRNVGGTGFVAAPEWGVDSSMGGGCSAAADLDGDGDDELLLCTTEASGNSSGARVFVNDAGRLTDRTSSLGISPAGERDIEVADFNDDGKPDLALLSQRLLSIYLANSEGGFDLAYRLDTTAATAIAVGDVNVDGYPDIYMARRIASNAEHYMLINDATGGDFAAMTIPQPGAGKSDDVLAIDYDGNGRMDFVTLNGSSLNGGPVKLTAFFPAP